MSIHVFRGLPGSGKSSRLIELVNSAIVANQPVLTFACSESPILAKREGLRVHHRLACRRLGLTCPLHHFVSTDDAATILSTESPGTLAAFEEAQFFNSKIVPYWIEASDRGLQVLISTPSNDQLQLLKSKPFTETVFEMKCQKCHISAASAFIIMPETNTTLAVCSKCNDEMAALARQDLLDRLQKQTPYPGEKSIYQPVDELPECADWKVVRPDSKARVNLMSQVIREVGLPESVAPNVATYLDVGCNTGYFCDQMRRLGFYSEGVDVVKADIEVAKMLDAFLRKGHNHYVLRDAYAYLEETQDHLFDVTSAFAVFQWLMIQTTVDRGIQCLEWLFAKTKRLCFLEMGYSVEPQYKEKLKVNIDREWVQHIMEEKGNFSEVRMFDAKEHDLMFGRDLFVGIKD